MATYITIVDTVKEGFFTINTNALYPTGAQTRQMNIRKDTINEINILLDHTNVEYIDVQLTNSDAGFTITNNTNQSKYWMIESVNGESVTDLDDLKNKIMALL